VRPFFARAGKPNEAIKLGEVAVSLSREMEAPNLLADALCELAIALACAGQQEESLQMLREASALYAAKGNVIGADRAQTIMRSQRDA